MRTYSVFEPKVLPSGTPQDAESLVFVRHGWSLAALFFAPLWMIVRRLWLVLLAYLLIGAAIQVLGLVVPPIVVVALTVALALIVMVEAGQLRLMTMEARGYREIAVLDARNQREAERTFFERWLKERDAVRTERDSRLPVLRPGSTTPTPIPGMGG
ncbi:MAG: DUF2628 domain-containing protein [Devosiaceae bacterium]|nr:DUF2628 domain-containing protein [Devosiaceae bacterium MH13]